MRQIPMLPKLTRLIGLSFFLLGLSANLVLAQSVSDELQLEVHRTFGYGNGNQIQGHFTLVATGVDLTSATFYIGTDVIGTATSAPFQVTMDTDNYPHGFHTLTVTGQTADGRTLTSRPHRYEFVDASAAGETAFRIVGPIVAVVFGLIALTFVVQFLPGLLGKRKVLPLGAPRRYGIKGGAICPKCGRPFGVHFLSINLVGSYFDYCDHCGKWSLVRRATPQQLADAQQAELALAQPETPIAEETPEAKLKRQLDETRFIDKP